SAKGWPSTGATSSPAPCAAPPCSGSSTPRTNATTARPARPAGSCSRTGRSRGSSRTTGRRPSTSCEPEASALRDRLLEGEALHHRLEERREPRPPRAPGAVAEAEVEVTQRASGVDRADGHAVELGDARLEDVERLVHLEELAVDPAFPPQLRGAQERLVAGEDGRIENAVGERVQPQRPPARLARRGEELHARGERIEVLADHDGIEERDAVRALEGGDLHEGRHARVVAVGLARHDLGGDD